MDKQMTTQGKSRTKKGRATKKKKTQSYTSEETCNVLSMLQGAMLLQQIEPINITVQSASSREATLSWTKPKAIVLTHSGQRQLKELENELFEYQIIGVDITNKIKVKMCNKMYNKTNMEIPFSLIPGHNYRFDISVRQIPTRMSFGIFSAFHKSVLTPWELNVLFTRALEFLSHDVPIPISVLYRNKPSHYFSDIFLNRNGVMEVYDKDHSGDPGSPINGQIKGLFFSTAAHPKTGALPKVSPFGNVRLVLPVQRFVNHLHNLYFTDFYCHKKKHLVTLVVTRKGSLVDNFCAAKLVKLPLTSKDSRNPFFFWDHITGQYYCSKRATVEVLYTENIDVLRELRLNFNCLSNVRTMGRGCSKPDSKPKNPNCEVCNLYMDTK